MEYIKARMSEASTWRGLVALVTALGVALSPEQVEAIVAIGLAVMGVVGAFIPDKSIA